MGYIYFIGSKKTGWVIANSVADRTDSYIFDTYREAKHFAGFTLTTGGNYEKWYKKYRDEEFNGGDYDWDYDNLNIRLRKSDIKQRKRENKKLDKIIIKMEKQL